MNNQNIDGNDNVQIIGNGNTINVSGPFHVNTNSHAAEMAMKSSPKVFRIISPFVEIPMIILFFILMMSTTYFAKEYLGSLLLYGTPMMLMLWYFLPYWYPSLFGTIFWDKISIGGSNGIDFRDINNMHWVGKKVYINTFGRVDREIEFVSTAGARDLFNAFSIYVKLRE